MRSDYVKSGKQPAAKGVDGLYTAINRLVLCKLKQTIADAGSNLATLVGDLVQIKGPLMGPANTDQAFLGSLLQSMYVPSNLLFCRALSNHDISNVSVPVFRCLLTHHLVVPLHASFICIHTWNRYAIAERAARTPGPDANQLLSLLVVMFREILAKSPDLMPTLSPEHHGKPTIRARPWGPEDLAPFAKARQYASEHIERLTSMQEAIDAKRQAAMHARVQAREVALQGARQLDQHLAELGVTQGLRVSTDSAKATADERVRRERREHKRADQQRYIADVWQQLDAGIRRERGIFGPARPDPAARWVLDAVEGPNRMRQRLAPHTNFYSLYVAPKTGHDDPESSPTRKQKNPPASHHVADFPAAAAVAAAKIVNEVAAKDSEASGAGPAVRSDNSGDSNGGEKRDGETDDALTDEGDELSDDMLALKLIEPGDTKLWEVEAQQAMGLDEIDGVLFYCKLSAYFIEGCGLTPARQLYTRKGQSQHVTRWKFEDIKDLRRRRFCLQDKGIEIFSIDGDNRLLVFPDRPTRDQVYDALINSATTLTTSTEDSIDGMQRDAKLEKEGLFAGLIPGGRTVTQRWEAGELTNFEYLMQLNTLAGRSYNDLNQYPVFPWVLADYTSETLDLSDPSIYRDLTKPMGAQTPKRAEGFQFRFENWEDPTGEGQPGFHYGTHYSSAQYVAGYLVRLEPYTQHFIKLQGGHFDHADRMFHSIAENWKSASELSNADVKELTPEFYYLPDFLVNENKFDIGVRQQDGVPLDDVQLPPWAMGSPDEFIRVHRAALESPYVSSMLHHWIDLIFGYKQRGEEAIKALNVFHHLTYEGAVDLDTIEDEVMRAATISTINNFGQTPKQLFKRPHPPRRATATVESGGEAEMIIAPSLASRLVTSALPYKEIGVPVGHLLPSSKNEVAVAGENELLVPPLYNRVLSWEPGTGVLRALGAVGERRDVAVYEGIHFGPVLCAAMPASGKILATGGSDSTVRVWSVGSSDRSLGRPRCLAVLQTLCGCVMAPCIACLCTVSGTLIVKSTCLLVWGLLVAPRVPMIIRPRD